MKECINITNKIKWNTYEIKLTHLNVFCCSKSCENKIKENKSICQSIVIQNQIF